jgi:hypothetical protein
MQEIGIVLLSPPDERLGKRASLYVQVAEFEAIHLHTLSSPKQTANAAASV